MVIPKVTVDTELLQMNNLTPLQWKELKQLQGRFRVLYLKLRYGSPNTYILLAYVEKVLAHVEWIVPAEKIVRRYNFVTDNSYSIIACLTSGSSRGLGIYPSQIQKVAESDIPAKMFWIWASAANVQSLKGIRKAGGVKVGEFIRGKLPKGCFSRIKYFPEGDK